MKIYVCGHRIQIPIGVMELMFHFENCSVKKNLCVLCKYICAVLSRNFDWRDFFEKFAVWIFLVGTLTIEIFVVEILTSNPDEWRDRFWRNSIWTRWIFTLVSDRIIFLHRSMRLCEQLKSTKFQTSQTSSLFLG